MVERVDVTLTASRRTFCDCKSESVGLYTLAGDVQKIEIRSRQLRLVARSEMTAPQASNAV